MRKDPTTLAQLIVRGEHINFGKSTFSEESGLYRFTNEDISSYFEHLKNKDKVLTVIGSGNQVINGILAGTENFDVFDISIFSEYYLYLQLASVMALSKEEYLEYYFSDDRDVLFCDDYYDRIRRFLPKKYRDFWDGLYMFDDGYDIYNSLLFRSDICLKSFAIKCNPYLQEDNYERVKSILKYGNININSFVCDVTKVKFDGSYDLVNLSNILPYNFSGDRIGNAIEFFKESFNLTDNGEIINYVFNMSSDVEDKFRELLELNGYIEELGDNKKLLVYRNRPIK